MFSPEAWYRAIAVDPPWQRQGIGTALVDAVLRRLRDLGAVGCVVLGDAAYYRRVGFGPSRGLVLPGVAPEHFTVLSLSGAWPAGTGAYHPAFAGGD